MLILSSLVKVTFFYLLIYFHLISGCLFQVTKFKLLIQIYFPFNIAEGEEIPYHRMQSIRVAVFITFTFYGALYLINSVREVYPIHFLKVFMISFGITSLVFSYQSEAGVKEIILGFFYLCCGLVFHLLSRPAIKKYFT